MNYNTYIISLSSDLDRREHMKGVMSKLNIPYQFFDAITPNDVDDEMVNTMFKNVDYYEWDINHKAVMATFLSHLSLLRVSHLTKTNLLILEDDIELVNGPTIDYNDVKFEEFDVFNIGTLISCYSYFVSWNGAGKILDMFSKNDIVKAYDWELYGIKNNINTTYPLYPEWKQVKTFKSNIAPNGYKRK
jgi:hypothetical protein